MKGTEVSRYYDVYAYLPGNDGEFYDSVLDWDSDFTTLAKTTSAYSDWFSNNNIVDNMINYQLSVGLGLLSSGN